MKDGWQKNDLICLRSYVESTQSKTHSNIIFVWFTLKVNIYYAKEIYKALDYRSDQALEVCSQENG